MRKYIELIELPENEMETGEKDRDFARIDVTGWADDDILTIIKELKAYAEKNISKYIIQIHKCNHDKGGRCEIEIIEKGGI